MKKKTENMRILWAVDAFPDSPDVQAQAGRAIATLLKSLSAVVQPVYVAPPPPPGLFLEESYGEQWMQAARRNLDWLFNLVSIDRLTAPHFLTAHFRDKSSLIESLLEYAKRQKFDLIVVGSHTRKGVARLFLGSFAESLVLKSPIPIVVASTKAQIAAREKIRRVFFPTDFSPASRQSFERAVAMAKSLDVDMFLFHQIEFLYSKLDYPFIMPPISQESIDEQIAGCASEGKRWAKWATDQGVKTTFHLSKSAQPAAISIVKTANRLRHCLIVINAQSNSFQTVLMGSVARQVIRAADCPVMVLREFLTANKTARVSPRAEASTA